jgi:hypothetical protein
MYHLDGYDGALAGEVADDREQDLGGAQRGQLTDVVVHRRQTAHYLARLRKNKEV